MHRRTCNYALLSALQADCLFCTSQIPPSSATRLRITLCTCVPNFRVGDAATKKLPREQNLRQNTVLLSFFWDAKNIVFWGHPITGCSCLRSGTALLGWRMPLAMVALHAALSLSSAFERSVHVLSALSSTSSGLWG